ncbi:MAG: MBL fold metallo-hydrolase [Candidatus Bathyarchaeia archaeon]
MKVTWLGNACLEINADRNILVDPNYLERSRIEPDLILITHEHDDHFAPDENRGFLEDADLFAPKYTLEKFGLHGNEVQPGDMIDGVNVLDSNC